METGTETSSKKSETGEIAEEAYVYHFLGPSRGDLHWISAHWRKERYAVTKEGYTETLYNLRKAIKCKRPGLLSSRVIILRDNARAHTARITLAGFGWIIFMRPLYSPDLAASDYYLFPLLKTWLRMQSFTSNADLETKVNAWFQKNNQSFYAHGIDLRVSRYDKYMNVHGDYVEK